MSIGLITKRFLSKVIDFKNEGTKKKWVTDLITELEATIDTVNSIVPVTNAAQPSGSYLTALTGDVTATGPGSVIATLANIAANSILGNNTGSPAHQLSLTAAQVKTLLAIVEGDITLSDITTDDVSTTKHGFAPKAPNDPTKFLRGDATYAAPISYSFVSGSNATTTGQTLVDITGLGLPLLANATYEFEAMLLAQSSNTSGNKYGVQYSVSGATVAATIIGESGLNVQYDLDGEVITALNTPNLLAYWHTGITFPVLLKGLIITGANAGNLTIQHLKAINGTSTVLINSFLKVRRIV